MSMGEALTYNNTTNSPDNKYLYNGKELQTDFELGWYDYGARFYDPALGRFHVLDKSAETYYPIAPFAYVGNNPIRRIDPDGNDGWDIVKGVFAAVTDNAALGLTQNRENTTYNDGSDYNLGQDIGDVLSIVIGIGEIGGGTTIAGGGAVVTVGSGGTLAVAGVPATAGGVAVATHGAAMTGTASANLMSQKGRVNTTKVSPTRKRAKDSRPKPKPAKEGQKQVTRQSKNKSGEGNKMKTDGGTQTEHFHDSNHNSKKKPNVHYRTTKKIKPNGN